jgi:hypothetical protein
VQALIARAHFAYRTEGAGFAMGHATYAVQATRAGQLRLRARLPKEQTPSRRRALEGAPLSLETIAIERGGVAVTKGPASSVHASADGRLVLERGLVSEELANQDEGVEQSWRFSERPTGRGDLVVRVRVAGLAYTTETDKGLHFVDAETGLGFRYGVATWVDAQGKTQVLRARYHAGAVHLTVPAELLDASSYPAVLDPLVTPELGTDAVVSSASNQTGSYRSSVVYGGGTYLVLWEDYRDTVNEPHIFAARVGMDGVVADPLGMQIGFGGKGEADPKVAFDGQNFLIVWQDWRAWEDDIYAQFLSPAGKLVGNNFAITSATNSQSSPSIAYSGSGYIVVWTDNRNSSTTGSEIYGAYVTVGGVVTAGSGSVNTSTTGWQNGPVVACDGSTRCLVAWTHPLAPNYDVYARMVSDKGVALLPEMPLAQGTHAELGPAVAWDPVSQIFFAVWDDDRNNGVALNTGRDLFGRPISYAGEPGKEFAITTASGHQSRGRLVADGANGYLFVWADSRTNPSQIMGIRLRSDLTFADAAEFAITTGSLQRQAPDVATSGREYLVVWRENANGVANRYVGRVAATLAQGTVLDSQPILASKAGNRQRVPGVAFDGTNYLLVWEDTRNDAQGDIFGVLVDPSGKLVASAATGLVFPRLDATPETNPVVGFDGTNYLVVWQRKKTSGTYDNDLYSTRVSKSGTVLDTTPKKVVATANDETDARVAFDGASYLVVWQDHNTSFTDSIAYGVSGALVDKTTGAVTGTVSIVAPGLSYSVTPAVAWGSSSYLVVYAYNYREIHAAVVTRSGTVTYVVAPLATGGSEGRRMPGVASNGSEFLVAYLKSGSSGTVSEVISAAVHADGTVFSTETNLSPGKVVSTPPPVVWDGWNYLVGWSDRSTSSNYDLEGAWVSGLGARVGGGFLSTEGSSEIAPAVAAEGTGRVLVAYHRYDGDPAFQADRVRFRFASLGGTLGAGCVKGTECSSGQCVDGVCCNTSCAGGTSDCQACSVAAGAAKDGTCAATTGTTCSDGSACTRTDTCQAGTCTGTNSVVCTAGLCHSSASCDPTSGACAYVNSVDGLACSDGNSCTQTDSCLTGTCTGGNPVVCSASDQCHTAGTCDPASGVCSNPAKGNGTACSDGNACTTTDTCQAGTCAGSNAVVCSASDPCHSVGTCDPANGTCSNPAKGNGVACNDGNACTQTDTCQTGTCTGAGSVACSASDQCHTAGTCDPTSGACSHPAKNNGTVCSDGDACTQADTCQGGSCSGASPVVCVAQDQCHSVGTCDSTTGVCSSPVKINGSACGDGNSCTRTDTCQNGSCSGGNSIVCSASDACHLAGVCNPSSGLCSDPAKPDNTGCDDGDPCTQSDTCQTGKCTGQNPVVCVASDQCHQAGACDPSTGQCSNPSKGDGLSCSDGNRCTQTDTCQAGKCTGKDPIACTAADLCHDAGTCSPDTGACSSPAKPNGTACGTSSGCTQTDTCQAGLCTTGPAITCPAPDACHTAGTCDGPTGKCVYPEKENGSSCSDGNACTQTDTCQAGSCVGGNPVACFASDQCHDVGECDPQTGACSDPAKANTSACSDGNACTRTDNCQGGVCMGFNPVVCAAQDACHSAGVCNQVTGKCSNPVVADQTPCSDNDACTLSDSCQGGLCTGAAPVVCAAKDQCHDVGLCDTLTGECSQPAKQESAACEDGNRCSGGDFCMEGACTAGTPVVCPLLDECHGEGVCDAVMGCVYASANEGGACDDGELCTVKDVCRDGVCAGEGEPCAADAGMVDAGAGDDAAGDASMVGPGDAGHGADASQVDAGEGDATTDVDPLVEEKELESFYACRVAAGSRGGAIGLAPLALLLLGLCARKRRPR